MGDIDAETLSWLNSLKLGEKLQYISDFENGYYMGVIFDKFNLTKGRKFKNTKDTACKFQNFKNVRDLLMENFNVQFPIQNILFNTKELLKTIKQCIIKYNHDKKEATLKRIETFSASKLQPQEQKLFANRQKDILSTSKMNQSKFPKKIQDIEQKLEKYKSIKTKHQLIALEDRKKQIQENRRVIEEHRLFQMSKIRTNHQFIKEHERKVYDVWMKTEQVKQARIEKEANLKSFLEEKKNKFYQSLRDQEVKSFKQGLQAFNLNCIRQGIQLEHDPDKPLRKTQQNFNKQIVMQRIKDNIKIHQKQRKQRIKRQNKKAVDAKQANIKSQAIWNENNLIEKYAKRIKSQIDICDKIKKTINRELAEQQEAAKKSSNRTFSELPEPKIDVNQRNQQYRKRKIQYLDEQVQRLQRRQKKHKAIAQNVLQALIHVVIQSQQHYHEKKGFNFQEWKNLEKEFLNYEKKDKRFKDQSKFIDSSYQQKALQYINDLSSWERVQPKQQKLQLSQVLSSIISIGFPDKAGPESKNLPLYMPLKIGFVGNSLSGKTTFSQKLSQKYGIVFINPVAIIAEAFQLNKQPPVEDPKKKKQSKKPEEQNPEKIALKQWGQGIIKRLSNPSSATIQHYIEAIQFKIKYNFTNKAGQEILKQFQESKVQQVERYNKALKDFQQLQKKGKKDPKKGVQQPDEPPTQRKYFYSKGFVIDGIDMTLDNLKEIQKRINGYLSFQQKINKKGQQIKETISNLIKVPKAIKPNKLNRGTFDLMIQIAVKEDILVTRQTGQKNKISLKDFSELEKYYADFGNELKKTKAYKKITNEGSIEEGIALIQSIIQNHLDDKYNQITKSKTLNIQEDCRIVNNQEASSPLSGLKQEQCQKIVQKLMSIYLKYSKTVSQCFSQFDNLRDDFSKAFLSTQQAFISIINRPDDKAGKILNFQENYNKLQSQKVNIVKDAEASKHLISKLDELYDGLWVSLQSKKNEAVTQRQKVLSSNMLNSQIQKIVQVARNLLQNELTLLVEVIFFIYNLNNALQGSEEEFSPEYLVLGIPPNLEPLFSFEKQQHTSDRLDYYTNQITQCLKDLQNWLSKKEKKLKIKKVTIIEKALAQFIDSRKDKIFHKISKIRERVKEYYLEYFCYFNILVNKMDDWIIQGIKYENEFVYDIYKSIKKSIQQAKKSGIKDLFVKDITDILHPLDSLPTNRLPIVHETQSNHFKINSYAIFMQEIKCLSSSGRIHFKVFQAYIEKRRKSQLLQKEFLSIQLDIMQQYLVTDDYCNYKEVALAMLLWNVKILEQDSINQYENSLAGRKQSTSQQYRIGKEDVTLDEFIIIPEITNDKSEERILKIFIFQIFRQDFRDSINIKQLIDTLRLFSQLQVYRYGDTLMMLHEASHKQAEPSTAK